MKKPKKNWVEWSCFGMGLFLLVGVIGYLLYDAARTGDLPPRIVFSFGSSEPASNHFLVPVVAANQGDRTAEGVHVQVILRTGEKVEQAEVVFDYLPRHGTRHAYVTFSSDPQNATSLEARAVGYTEP